MEMCQAEEMVIYMEEMINGPTNIVLWLRKSIDLMKRRGRNQYPESTSMFIHSSSTSAIFVHYYILATVREGFFSARHDFQGKAEKRYSRL